MTDIVRNPGLYCTVRNSTLGAVVVAIWGTFAFLTLASRPVVAAIPFEIEVVDSAGVVGTYGSIAVDSQDRPHVAYYGGALKYALKSGGTWTIEIVDALDGNAGLYTSIALDPEDEQPVISYYQETQQDLKVARKAGMVWITEIVDGAGGEFAGGSTGLARPTPFGESGTTFVFRVPASASGARIGVFDMTGRRVRTLGIDTTAPALNKAYWNGCDESGRDVAAGVYVARLSWNGVPRATERVTVVR